MRRQLLTALVVGLAAAAGGLAEEPELLTEGTYAQVRDHVLPSAEELAFRERGWRPTFWEAVVEAQRRRTPILLWAMNGHPLGCT